MKELKIKGNTVSGFSLSETLMAVLILLLVASVIAAGIPAATSAYRNAVDGANAQTILSTTVNALRSELSTAWDINVDAVNNVIEYNCSRTGARTKLYNDSGTIKVQDYYIPGASPQPTGERNLISETITKKSRNATENYGLAFTINSTSAPGTVTFSAVIVKDGTATPSSDVASIGPITVRFLNP